jgi:hypothetical protein
MTEAALIIVSAIGLLVATMRLPDERRIKRKLATARLHVGPLPDGATVTIGGKVEPIATYELVDAPITHKRCVFWQVTVEEVGTGDDSVEIGRASGGCSFMLTGTHGSARVVPDGALAALPKSRVVLYPTWEMFQRNPRDNILAFGQSICRKDPNHPLHTRVRVTEYSLYEGAEIRVMGWCTQEPVADATEAAAEYRGAAPTRAVISGSRRTRLLIG